MPERADWVVIKLGFAFWTAAGALVGLALAHELGWIP